MFAFDFKFQIAAHFLQFAIGKKVNRQFTSLKKYYFDWRNAPQITSPKPLRPVERTFYAERNFFYWFTFIIYLFYFTRFVFIGSPRLLGFAPKLVIFMSRFGDFWRHSSGRW